MTPGGTYTLKLNVAEHPQGHLVPPVLAGLAVELLDEDQPQRPHRRQVPREQAAFPVVAKNAKPWVRWRAPVVGGTTVLHIPPELLALARAVDEEFSLLVQEYIPLAYAEDWIVHLHRREL